MVLFGTRKKAELRSAKRIAKLSLETASIIIQFLRYFDKFKKITHSARALHGRGSISSVKFYVLKQKPRETESPHFVWWLVCF